MSTTKTAVAFALTDEYTGTVEQIAEEGADPVEVPVFQGGQVALPPEGKTLDLAEELEDGDGVIVVPTTQEAVIEILRGVHCLREVPVPDGRDLAAGGAAYDHASARALKAEAKRRGISPLPSTKAELVSRLEAHDAALQAGDQGAADAIAAGGGTDEGV